MSIIWKDENRTKKLGDLNPGTFFAFELNGIVYVKTDVSDGEGYIKYVDLESGVLDAIYPGALVVELADVDIVVKGA